MKTKPVEMVLNRNYILRTQYGHTIGFKKDKPVMVPPLAYEAAVSIGAQPSDGTPPDVIEDEKPAPQPPVDSLERQAQLFDVFAKLEERNDRGDFTGTGNPAKKPVCQELGYDVQAKEIATAWQKYLESKVDEGS